MKYQTILNTLNFKFAQHILEKIIEIMKLILIILFKYKSPTLLLEFNISTI